MPATALHYLTPLALVATLAACNSRTDTTNTTTSDTAVMANNTAGMPTNITDTAAATSPAQVFADKAAKSDAFEIAAAKLAQTNAASDDIKAFATKMILAHTDSTAKIKKAAAAASPSITPDANLTDEQSAKLSDLSKLNGADFDKAYASGQVDAHNEALSAMKDYAATGDAPTLKKVAGEIVPVVQDHLAMARALNQK